VHHVAVHQGNAGEEHHPDREASPRERPRPAARKRSAGDEREETAEDREDEAERDGDVDRPPQGRRREHAGLLGEPAGGDGVKDEARGHQDSGDREDVSRRARGARLSQRDGRVRGREPSASG